ncbi:hypothetical protein [Barrientosiimonas humi]|uniref:hypothetical protein n=1 Tax=Barrientosiimonas humi TaxID=999931 RepID=UPI00370D60DD
MKMATVRRALVGAGAAAVLTITGTGAAEAANYVAGPFGSLSSCNSERYYYVKDGGFSYVGSCYQQSNNYWYFQYR